LAVALAAGTSSSFTLVASAALAAFAAGTSSTATTCLFAISLVDTSFIINFTS